MRLDAAGLVPYRMGSVGPEPIYNVPAAGTIGGRMGRYSPRALEPEPVGFLLLRLDWVRRAMRVMERKRTGGLGVWLAVVGLLLVGLVRPVSAQQRRCPLQLAGYSVASIPLFHLLNRPNLPLYFSLLVVLTMGSTSVGVPAELGLLEGDIRQRFLSKVNRPRKDDARQI